MRRQGQVLKSFVIAACVLLGGCDRPDRGSGDPRTDGNAITANGIPDPLSSDADAKAAAIRALSGEPEAASNLANHFLGERKDLERARFWEQVAIENRAAASLLARGNNLIHSEDPCFITRGIFMLELALEHPSPAMEKALDGWKQTVAQARERSHGMSESCLGLTHIPATF